MTELEKLVEKDAIRDQYYVYARALDRIDNPLGKTVFAEDAQVDYGPTYKGTGYGFIDMMLKMHRKMVSTHHVMTNILIKLNEDGTKVALMDNDAAVKAARFLYDLKFKYGVLPEESMALVGTEVRNQFIEGNIAIASMDAKSGTVLTDAGVNWDFIPSLEDETRATWIASDALIMNSASQNKELAASLIKYITSAEVMAKFHTEIAPFPPITRDEAYNDDERFKEMYEDAEHLHTLPVANGAFKVMDTLYKNLQLMMLGDLSPEEAIQNTVDYAESIG